MPPTHDELLLDGREADKLQGVLCSYGVPSERMHLSPVQHLQPRPRLSSTQEMTLPAEVWVQNYRGTRERQSLLFFLPLPSQTHRLQFLDSKKHLEVLLIGL